MILDALGCATGGWRGCRLINDRQAKREAA